MLIWPVIPVWKPAVVTHRRVRGAVTTTHPGPRPSVRGDHQGGTRTARETRSGSTLAVRVWGCPRRRTGPCYGITRDERISVSAFSRRRWVSNRFPTLNVLMAWVCRFVRLYTTGITVLFEFE